MYSLHTQQHQSNPYYASVTCITLYFIYKLNARHIDNNISKWWIEAKRTEEKMEKREEKKIEFEYTFDHLPLDECISCIFFYFIFRFINK